MININKIESICRKSGRNIKVLDFKKIYNYFYITYTENNLNSSTKEVVAADDRDAIDWMICDYGNDSRKY